MDQPYGIPSCVHSIILWFVPNTVLPQWCCACTSTAEVAEAHPCWQHRSLQCFGGELLELRFTGGSAWRKLYGRLALAINHLRLGKPTLREGLRFETSAAAWDLELQLGARPAGSSLALWAEEGGHSIQFWSIESLRLLTQWSPFTRLDQTLMTFGVSVGEQLLLAVDSAEMLHVACMESKGVVDLMAIPLFMEGGRSILPCSVAVRCGMLSFVHFIAFKDHADDPQYLTAATLAHLPRDIVRYYMGNGIKHGPQPSIPNPRATCADVRHRPRGLHRFEDKDGNPLPKHLIQEPLVATSVPVKALRIPSSSTNQSREASKANSQAPSSLNNTAVGSGTKSPGLSKSPHHSTVNTPTGSRLPSRSKELRLEDNAEDDNEPWIEAEKDSLFEGSLHGLGL
eukprot:g27476.t1